MYGSRDHDLVRQIRRTAIKLDRLNLVHDLKWKCTRVLSQDETRVVLYFTFLPDGPNQAPVLRTEDLVHAPSADPRGVVQAVADRLAEEDELSH